MEKIELPNITTKQDCEAFRGVYVATRNMSLDFAELCKIYNATKTAVAIIFKKNPKYCHLCKYAKKYRTRKKNFGKLVMIGVKIMKGEEKC